MLFEIIKAILYGVVEGVTEWLPVSSTGHMILFEEILPMKVSPEFWNVFLVVIQLGAILAVVLLYWNKIFQGPALSGRTRMRRSTRSPKRRRNCARPWPPATRTS